MMTDEMSQHQDSQAGSNFDEIKELASKNIGSMLRDLQDFEEAIKNEDVSEIYRIYKGRLHKELKETSNKNHEIDELLAQKIQDRFLATFPFMVHDQKISPTMHYYTIGQYYRKRPTIGIDSSRPEVFILPQVDQEWEAYDKDPNSQLAAIEQQMDQLDAKSITAKSEIETLDQQIAIVNDKKKTAEDAKGLFNRGKADEEMEELNKQIKILQNQRDELQRFVGNTASVDRQKNDLMEQYHQVRLNRAVITKEMRLIKKEFGSLAQMNEAIQSFLKDFVQSKKGGADHE